MRGSWQLHDFHEIRGRGTCNNWNVWRGAIAISKPSSIGIASKVGTHIEPNLWEREKSGENLRRRVAGNGKLVKDDVAAHK